MSYPFDNYLTRVRTGDLDEETATLKVLLVVEGSKLDPRTAGAYFGLGQPSAANLAAIVTLSELSDANYARKTLASHVVSINTSTTPHRSQATFSALEYTPAIGTLALPVIGAVVYDEGGGAEATRLPLWYINTGAGFPWSGGSDLYVIAPTGGWLRMEGR